MCVASNQDSLLHENMNCKCKSSRYEECTIFMCSVQIRETKFVFFIPYCVFSQNLRRLPIE